MNKGHYFSCVFSTFILVFRVFQVITSISITGFPKVM